MKTAVRLSQEEVDDLVDSQAHYVCCRDIRYSMCGLIFPSTVEASSTDTKCALCVEIISHDDERILADGSVLCPKYQVCTYGEE